MKNFFKDKKKVLSAVLSIFLIASTVGAGTYAWFTSQATATVGNAAAGIVKLTSNRNLIIPTDDFDNYDVNDFAWNIGTDFNGGSVNDPKKLNPYLVPGRGICYEVSVNNDSNVPIVIRLSLDEIQLTFYKVDSDKNVIDSNIVWKTFKGTSKIGELLTSYAIDSAVDNDPFAVSAIVEKSIAQNPIDLSDSLLINVYNSDWNLLSDTNATMFGNKIVKGTDGAYYVYIDPDNASTLTSDILYFVIAIQGQKYNQLPLQNMKVDIGNEKTLGNGDFDGVIKVQAVQATNKALTEIWKDAVDWDNIFGIK